MKKKVLIFLVALITIFSSSQVFAKDTNNKVTKELSEVDEIVKDLDDVAKEQENITDDELDDAIDDVINLQEYDLQNERDLRDKFQKGVDSTNKVIEIVDRQIQLKTQFVQNIIEVYNTTARIEQDMVSIKRELNDIVTSKERDLTGEEYEQIKGAVKELKKEAKEADYVAGSIFRETRNYIGHVKRKEFRSAMRSFERIVQLQEQQLDLLRTLENNTSNLKAELSKAGYN